MAESDVDLIVVLPYRGSHTDKVLEIRGRVEAPIPLDLLVWRPDEATQSRRLQPRAVLSEGKGVKTQDVMALTRGEE